MKSYRKKLASGKQMLGVAILTLGLASIFVTHSASAAPDKFQTTTIIQAGHTTTARVLTSGYFRIVNRNSGKVLEVQYSSTGDGGVVDQWDYNGTATQQWSILSTSDGYSELINRNSGKILEVQYSSTGDGGIVDQWDYNGSHTQQWSIEPI